MKSLKKNIPVELQRQRYEISIEQGVLETFTLPKELANKKYQRAVVISDSNVAKLYLPKFKRRLKKEIAEVNSAVCPAGELSKSAEMANSLWQKLSGFQADRDTLVVALGGGVVGDLAGFVAATYMRGLDLLQVPTTLLAQVDSSVGGKVGINLPQGKNLVGAFWQPCSVVIDPGVLLSLDDREYRAGLAEVVKYGMIMDAGFFEFLERHLLQIVSRDQFVLTDLIARCCEMKAEVVMADERDTSGRRALLNFGHTYGHALENVSGYGKLLHGEAVSIGMVCACRLAVDLKLLDLQAKQRLQDLLVVLGLPTSLPKLPHEKVVLAMHSDKKKSGDAISLVLPTRIGSVQLVTWPGDDLVQKSLNSG